MPNNSRTLRLCALLAMVAGALPTAPVSAQDNVPWRLSYFPYLTASPNDGVMGIARAIWFQQAGWGERVTLAQYVAVEAGYSTRDAWKASVTYGAPRLTDDWRLMAHAEIGHEPNFGDLDSPFGARMIRDRQVAWVDVTRRLHGPLHVAVRPAIRKTSLELRVGDVSGDVDETDLSVRGALVLDTRDREFEENSGGLVEVGAITGTGGGGKGNGYAAPYLHARGWVHPYLPLRLTGRVAWRGTTGSGAIAPAYEFPGWEEDFTILGGHESQRGLPIGARGVDGVVLAGAEARFDVINIGEIGAVTLIAFADGSKLLFGGDDLSFDVSRVATSLQGIAPPSVRDWTWAAGGGIALRVLRAATLTITAARANHDTRWYVGSGWSW
ncbi:MAG: BamA/TamA family outer membrane protein [Gemmatimonadota bacterium]